MRVDDPTIGYLIVFVLPVVFYFFINIHNIRLLPLFFIFVIPFLAGALELLGILTVSHYNIAVEMIILLLFIQCYATKKDRSFHFLGYSYVFGFIGISVLSYFVNDTSLLQLLLFFRKYLLPILFFWLLMNVDLTERDYRYFNKLIIGLFLTQIPVAFGKYFIVGQAERYMGTMTIGGGSLTTSFALFGMITYLSFFLHQKKYTYLLAVAGFFLFSIIGNKRAILFYAPIIMVAVFYFANINLNLTKTFKKALPAVPIMILFFYLSVTLIPSLNPEHQIGGSFDRNHVSNYVENYLFPGRHIRGSDYYGRGEAPFAVWDLMVNESDAVNILLGFGAGDLLMSRFIETDPSLRRREDIIAYKFNIGYGGRTGLILLILQVGVLGAALLFLFYAYIFKIIFKVYKKSEIEHPLYFMVLSLFILFFLDTLTYSITMLEALPVVMPFIWFVSQGIKNIEIIQLNRRIW